MIRKTYKPKVILHLYRESKTELWKIIFFNAILIQVIMPLIAYIGRKRSCRFISMTLSNPSLGITSSAINNILQFFGRGFLLVQVEVDNQG